MRPQIPSLVERLCPITRYAGRGVCIAFVDSGFFPHSDLRLPRGRIRAYVDVTREQPEPSELLERKAGSWHGTMTTCCAAGNGYMSGGRYRGLASESDVVLIKSKEDGEDVRAAHIISALGVPLRHEGLGVRVMSVSIGVDPGDPETDAIHAAVDAAIRAGIVVVVAAGNTPDRAPSAPASAKNAITVGGYDDGATIDGGDDKPWPSSHGNGKPDLLAPSAWVPAPMVPGTLEAREAHALYDLLGVLEEMSLVPNAVNDEVLAQIGDRIEKQKYIARDYQHVDGTSFAAPIVSSIIAQMLEANPKLSPEEVRAGLLQTARKLEGVPEEIQGAGLVQAAAAVEWAESRHG